MLAGRIVVFARLLSKCPAVRVVLFSIIPPRMLGRDNKRFCMQIWVSNPPFHLNKPSMDIGASFHTKQAQIGLCS